MQYAGGQKLYGQLVDFLSSRAQPAFMQNNDKKHYLSRTIAKAHTHTHASAGSSPLTASSRRIFQSLCLPLRARHLFISLGVPCSLSLPTPDGIVKGQPSTINEEEKRWVQRIVGEQSETARLLLNNYASLACEILYIYIYVCVCVCVFVLGETPKPLLSRIPIKVFLFLHKKKK